MLPKSSLSKTILTAILGGLIFLISFGVRFYNWQVEGINPDEPVWQQRIENFSTAISKGEWQYTQQSLHPAVPLSILGTIGRAVGGFLPASKFTYPFADPQVFWNVHFYELLMIILVTSLSVVGVYLLLKKLLGNYVALIGSVAIALEPFFIANSRNVQMDAILASFTILSFLTLIVFQKEKKYRWLIISGILAGLTVLTKINGVVIIAAGVLILASDLLRQVVVTRAIKVSELKKTGINILIFLLVPAATFFLLFPAMWVQPVLTIKNLIYGILNRGLTDGGESVGDSFFLGKVSNNPGLLYYPVTLALRSTPLAILGLLSSIIVLFKSFKLTATKRSFILASLLVIFLSLLEMSLVSKKSERYMLPLFLFFDLLLAVGFGEIFQYFSQKLKRNFKYLWLCLPIIALLAQFYLLARPLSSHFGSYYNPLFGGSKTAEQLITVGWGEGNVEIASYINALPQPWLVNVSVFYADSVSPLVKVSDIWYPGHWNRGDRDADYVVFYINEIQRQKDLGLWQEYKDKKPLETVKINGLNYAYIYKGPRKT